VSLAQDPAPISTQTERGRLQWGGIAVAALFAAVSLGVGGLLGTWQWDRAHARATPVEPDPRAAIAEVMRPGEGGRGEGRLVTASGTWEALPAALVAGKEIEGEEAVLLILPLRIGADDTGTGEAGTLPVLAGWLPAALAPDAVPELAGDAALTGYVRGGEGSAPPPGEPDVDGAFWIGSMSTAVLAQQWPAPLYSYMVVADEPAQGWNALPAPEQQTRLDFQSLTYSVEWWVFGVFGAVLALRWIRDNGRARPAEEDA